MAFLVIIHVPYVPLPTKEWEQLKEELEPHKYDSTKPVEKTDFDETVDVESTDKTGTESGNEEVEPDIDEEEATDSSDEWDYSDTTEDTSEPEDPENKGQTVVEGCTEDDTSTDPLDKKCIPNNIKKCTPSVETVPAGEKTHDEILESNTTVGVPVSGTEDTKLVVLKKKKTFGVTRVSSQEQAASVVEKERKKRKKRKEKKKKKEQDKILEEKEKNADSRSAKTLTLDVNKRPSDASVKLEPDSMEVADLQAGSSENSESEKEVVKRPSDGSVEMKLLKPEDKKEKKGSLEHLFAPPGTDVDQPLLDRSRSESTDKEPDVDVSKQSLSEKSSSQKSLTDVNENSKSEVREDEDDKKNDEEKEPVDEEAVELLEDMSPEDTPLTPLFEKIPIHKRVEMELEKMGVEAVEIEIVGNDKYSKFSFLQDDSQRCEKILNRLRGIGVGLTAGSSLSVFPSSLHESGTKESDSQIASIDDDSPVKKKSEVLAEKKSEFKKSVKSRLLVAQVVKSVTANALFTFDYLLLLILAGLIACLGLVENSSVVLVASMLISPLMGPILAATFGQVIRKQDLRDLGLKSEIKGLVICLVVGFLFGLVAGGVGIHGAVWGSTDSWPTAEMKSRGMLRSLWVGVLIALPSGAGVAISVLGGNSGSLVGVAISASLLPPACNAGMLWAYALLAAIRPPEFVSLDAAATTTAAPNVTTISSNTSTFLPPSSTTVLPKSDGLNCPTLVNNNYEAVYFCNTAHESAILGLVSLFLTIVNICCIIIMGVLVLKIKEVAPQTAGVDTFWREDVHVARGYYSTTKGQSSKNLGKTFLEEYKRIQAQAREKKKRKETESESDSSDSEDLADEMAAIEVQQCMQDIERSVGFQQVTSKLPDAYAEAAAEDLKLEFTQAQQLLAEKLSRKPEVYLADPTVKAPAFRSKHYQRAYQTIQSVNSDSRPEVSSIFQPQRRLSVSSGHDSYTNVNEKLPASPKGFTGQGLFRKRKQKVQFQVTKVDEQ